jgi:hypothetical protein
MVKGMSLGILAAAGLALGSLGGLEAHADTATLNGATNVTFGAFTQNATGTVDRTSTEYLVEPSTGTGGTVSPESSYWTSEGDNSGDIVFQPGVGYHLSSVTTNGVYAGNSLTNNFVVNGPLEVVGSFALNTYDFVFRDERADVDVTNTVVHGSNFTTNFPEYIYSLDGKTRYRAETVTGDGVNVSTSSP